MLSEMRSKEAIVPRTRRISRPVALRQSTEAEPRTALMEAARKAKKLCSYPAPPVARAGKKAAATLAKLQPQDEARLLLVKQQYRGLLKRPTRRDMFLEGASSSLQSASSAAMLESGVRSEKRTFYSPDSASFGSVARLETFLEGTTSSLGSECCSTMLDVEGESDDYISSSAPSPRERLGTFLEETASSLHSACSAAMAELDVGSNQSTSSSTESECAICFESYADSEESRIFLPCCHSFHECCALPWISLKKTCPTCRYPTCSSDWDFETY